MHPQVTGINWPKNLQQINFVILFPMWNPSLYKPATRGRTVDTRCSHHISLKFHWSGKSFHLSTGIFNWFTRNNTTHFCLFVCLLKTVCDFFQVWQWIPETLEYFFSRLRVPWFGSNHCHEVINKKTWINYKIIKIYHLILLNKTQYFKYICEN